MDAQSTGYKFRELLRQELIRRTNKNAKYSLRSFAKALGVSPAGLSMIMNGKKPVTVSFITKVSSALRLAPRDIVKYQSNLLHEKLATDSDSKSYQIIDLDILSIIAEWYHYAILNLIRVKGFKSQSHWIARRLGVTAPEVQSALERLIKVGMLSIDKNKNLVDTSNKFTSHVPQNRTSEAARENQRQLFKLAKEAIDTAKFEDRSHTGVTLAFDKKDLEKAKKMIAEFRREFHETFDKSKEADAVYHLAIGLFPLSKE